MRGAVLLAALALIACRPATPRLVELREVLASRDDNDPRLDGAFNSLTAEERAAFRAEYRKLPRERRNERGTIVYLLGKNLKAPEDWDFLVEVAGEEPCLSLADCAKAQPDAASDGDAVTLAYPALVALKQAERALDAGGPDAGSAEKVVSAGAASRAPAAQRLAERISRRKRR